MKAKRKRATPAPHRGGKKSAKKEVYDLRLYVAGQAPRSLAAFANLKQLCDLHLAGKYKIEVIDLMKKPQLARDDEVIAIPTLVRRLPQPIRKIIGDLCDTQRTLRGLDLFVNEGNGSDD
jgi:circadian clock protein KaiB